MHEDSHLESAYEDRFGPEVDFDYETYYDDDEGDDQ